MALREMHVDVNWRRKGLLVSAAILVMTLLGPFGTFTHMSLATRFAYWSTAIVSVGVLMNLLFILALGSRTLRRFPPIFRIFVAASLGAIPGGLMIVGVERIFKGPLTGAINFGWLMLCVWLLTMVIGVFDLATFSIRRRMDRGGGGGAFDSATDMDEVMLKWRPDPSSIMAASVAAPTAAAHTATRPDRTDASSASPDDAPPETLKPDGKSPCVAPAFFGRLPPEVGHELISLTMQDHYLKVRTDKGSCMILHRITDAETELEKFPGIRVHRSHWVALRHVCAVNSKGSARYVELSDGKKLPVSRTYLPKLRTALNRIGNNAAN